VTFALAPFWSKPAVRPWIQAAAITAVLGILGTLVAVRLTPDP
jgi:hypothetical protein